MEGEAMQAVFNGWAVVEMMGHRKEIGFVTTEAYGPAVMFRVDTPELPERIYTLARPMYIDGRWTDAGTKVKREATPARSCLVAPGSLYAINPCTEEVAIAAIEREFRRPLMLVDSRALPAATLLDAQPYDPDEEDDDEDDDNDEDEAAAQMRARLTEFDNTHPLFPDQVDEVRRGRVTTA